MKNVHEIAAILRGQYHDFAHNNLRNPLYELLFIICSVKTSEKRYRESFRNLRRSFPRAELLDSANVADIEKALGSAGLVKQKAVSIRKLLDSISKTFGKPTLAPLNKMSDDQAEKYLVSLPGVGKKIARCVLMYSLDRKVFPVDVHCCRIARRLGWIANSGKSQWCNDREMDLLQDLVPQNLRYSLHVNMVSLGRQYCKSQNPLCGECPITDACDKCY